MTVVLVTGSRDWTDDVAIREALSTFGPGTVVVHGGARGADAVADRIARSLGFEVRSYPAEWQRYGKAAGAIRNAMMLEKERPDLVLAFPLPQSRGTVDMMQKARAAGVTVEEWKEKP